jgi:hypothetical protein
MRHLHIVTAKIKPSIYALIQDGSKHYEIRNESFQGAQAICYVSADSGRTLGIHMLGPELTLGRDTDDLALQQLSGLDRRSYLSMFPKALIPTQPVLYAAGIGKPINDIMSVINPQHHGTA